MESMNTCSNNISMRPLSTVSRLRATIEDATLFGNLVVLCQNVLRGAFSSDSTLSQWKCPSFKLIVFISSTFTDTTLERNYLLDELVFELREKGASQGSWLYRMSSLQFCAMN